ncbi:MAG: type III pantothenate kinase [Elusimicrobiota bacterium]
MNSLSKVVAIDVGNTKTAFAEFRGKKVVNKYVILNQELRTNKGIARLQKILGEMKPKPATVFVSSVVPGLTKIIKNVCSRTTDIKLRILNVNSVTTVLPVRYKNSDKLGIDRLMGAVAGKVLYGAPCIVIDAGTALTFNIVDSTGRFIGGYILPGMQTAAGALPKSTAQLPTVELKKFGVGHKIRIGSSTKECIGFGIIYGYRALVDGLVQKLRKRYGKNIKVVLTGTAGKLFRFVGNSVYDPILVLKGIGFVGIKIECQNVIR